MTTWETNVTEVVWESQTAPGITWTTVVGGTGGTTVPDRRLLPNTVGSPGQMPAVNGAGTAVEYVDAPSGSGATTAAELEVDDSAYPGITAANQEEFNDAAYAGLIDHGTAIADLGNRTNDTETAISGLEATRVTYTELTTAVDAKVADAINDGTTTVAPSQNAVFDALAPKAPLASPALTGNPTAPTQAQGNNTTRIATTEFVHTEASLLVPKALVDAKGDLLVATAPDTVARLPVGTDGQVLVADSAQTPGVKWAGAIAGITNGMPRVSGDTVRAFTVPGVIVQGLGTVTPSSNRTVFQPIRLDRQRTFDQVQIEVTAAAVSGSRCRTAIYAVDDYWQATDLLFDSGQMANDAIAVVTAGISLTLPSGNYMMVTVSQGSAAFRVAYCVPPWLNAFKAAAGVAGYLNVFTAGGNLNVANGFPATADSTVKFEGATGSTTFTIAYFARLREAA